MITKIKLRLIKMTKDLLNYPVYYEEDITSQLKIPINNSLRRDEVLDTTSIQLLNREREPLKPCTRLIFTLTDTLDDGTEKEFFIYRIVERDNPSLFCFGVDPIYQHSVSLIEITKELERHDVTNLTVTNYLAEGYGATRDMFYYDSREYHNFAQHDASFIARTLGGYLQDYYSDSKRFTGPWRVLSENSEDNIIPLYVRLNVRYQWFKNYWSLIFGNLINNSGWKHTYLLLSDFYVIEPDGTKVQLSQAKTATYEYKTVGTYKFCQVYTYGDVPENYKAESIENKYSRYPLETWFYKEFSWTVTVVDDESLIPRIYTIRDVLERLLKTFKTRRVSLIKHEEETDDGVQEPEVETTDTQKISSLINKLYYHLTADVSDLTDEEKLTELASMLSFEVYTSDEINDDWYYQNLLRIYDASNVKFSELGQETMPDYTDLSVVEIVNNLYNAWDIDYVEDTSGSENDFPVRDGVVGNSLDDEDIDEMMFKLDPSILNRPELTQLSPEFAFTQGTLFECLSLVGSYINAIPRLIPDVRESIVLNDDGSEEKTRNDFTYWNVITFDFLSDREEYSGSKSFLIDSSHSIDDYATNLVSNLQNATESNYEGNTTMVEPFINGAISTRTESADFEISNETAIIKTTKPIRSLLKLTAKWDNYSVDITDRVKEFATYDLLPTYTQNSNMVNNKACYLYYKKGSPNINGLTYLRPTQTFFNSFSNDIAIRNIINIATNGETKGPAYIKDLSFCIEYIPFQTLKVRQFKEYIEDDQASGTLFFNQQATNVDIDSFGENMKSTLLKTGNETWEETTYFNHYSDLPKCGQFRNDYCCYYINTEIYTGSVIKASIGWSKHYNKANEYLALKSTIRQFEISEEESLDRNIDYQEFCIVDTKLDSERIRDNFEVNADGDLIVKFGGEDGVLNVKDINSLFLMLNKKYSRAGFASEQFRNQFSLKLNNADVSEFKSISYVIIQTLNEVNEVINTFLLPVSCFAFGNSIVMHFKTTDNYSAGTSSLNPSEVENEADITEKVGTDIVVVKSKSSYNLESYIEYGNEIGRFKTCKVLFGYNSPLKNKAGVITNAQKLYRVNADDINFDDIIVNFSNYPFYVDKDSREEIGFTIQLNFVTTNKNIILGRSLSHTTSVVGNTKTKYYFCVFKKKPNHFKSVLDESMFIKNYETNIEECYLNSITTADSSVKIESKIACHDGVGYGIVDNENRLVVYVDGSVTKGQELKPIYFMFRSNV